jgi:hypothetical protein
MRGKRHRHKAFGKRVRLPLSVWRHVPLFDFSLDMRMLTGSNGESDGLDEATDIRPYTHPVMVE